MLANSICQTNKNKAEKLSYRVLKFALIASFVQSAIGMTTSGEEQLVGTFNKIQKGWSRSKIRTFKYNALTQTLKYEINAGKSKQINLSGMKNMKATGEDTVEFICGDKKQRILRSCAETKEGEMDKLRAILGIGNQPTQKPIMIEEIPDAPNTPQVQSGNVNGKQEWKKSWQNGKPGWELPNGEFVAAIFEDEEYLVFFEYVGVGEEASESEHKRGIEWFDVKKVKFSEIKNTERIMPFSEVKFYWKYEETFEKFWTNNWRERERRRLKTSPVMHRLLQQIESRH